ncbi:hypothetical protein O181_075920 [Austropuccinia psidii MF-1]|uniref:Chromo domain-containing protein n=1 Tax=Austropuccinia psidii MF-1 TaxID=1389203 RepID=A0A9Q3F7L2_9BASI|nr:hypothetical protein [Austropuccinia psidii MF-1]
MVRKICEYGLEFKDCDGFTHDWCTLLPALELEYKTSIHASTNQTPLQDLFKALHWENAIEIELSEELGNKYPKLEVSLVKTYTSSDAEKFPLRNRAPQNIPPIESSGTRKITKVLKERKLRAKKLREYLVGYSDPTCEDEWLSEKDIPEATKLLKRFRNTRNNNITK